MRTKFATGMLLGVLASACTSQTPATSQPPATTGTAPAPAAEPAAAPATPNATPPSAPDSAALAPATPATADVPSAARGTAPGAPAAPAAPPPPPPAPRFREVTLPAGTELPLRLETALASDTSAVEDPVRASLRRDVVIDEVTALPAGTDLRGVVTGVQRSAKVKGRASLAFRFTSLALGRRVARHPHVERRPGGSGHQEEGRHQDWRRRRRRRDHRRHRRRRQGRGHRHGGWRGRRHGHGAGHARR